MISVTILTKNCQSTIRNTLMSVSAFDEVLIWDTGSVDATLDIARQFPNVVIQNAEFIGFGPTHNQASTFAKHDWILSLDSDEVVSEELVEEILKAPLSPDTVYSIRRDNYFNGKHIRCCGGWYPDWIVRLYNRGATRFNEAAVHEKVVTQGFKVKRLRGSLEHVPYREIGDFLIKMHNYSTLFALQNKDKKRSSVLKAVIHGWSAFIKSYIFKRGFLGGKEGLIISMYNSHSTFYKYLKLAEKQ